MYGFLRARIFKNSSWRQRRQNTVFRWPFLDRRLLHFLIGILIACGMLTGVAFMTTNASYVNVLRNGNFEHGFYSAPGCGIVGNEWHCFTNGGAANYGYYDDRWQPVVADGEHSQLIEINTEGLGAADADRYAGIYQTVQVVPWGNYTLNLKGMIRTTVLDGDPWRYRVEVGWTHGGHADWTKVTNWMDVSWDTYYERTSPGSFSDFSKLFEAEASYVTIYIRIWKKWGVTGEEIDLNLDAISLTGPSVGYQTGYIEKEYRPKYTKGFPTGGGHHYGKGTGGYDPGPAPTKSHEPSTKVFVGQAPSSSKTTTTVTTCEGNELIYNGTFEHGFNHVSVGHVGKSWGFFTNGGAANYGFYDEQWPPVVYEGTHGQLIEINNKGIAPADHDRYAGIYQKITGLYPGAIYQLSLKGLLRGEGNTDDDHRFEAQWGYNEGHDKAWEHVQNWTGMDLGPIYPRTEPGSLGMYSVQFKAPAHSIVLFIRGWKKWGITGDEMDFNLDAISLRHCVAKTEHHYDSRPHRPKAHHPKPHRPKQHRSKAHHGKGGPHNQCVYNVKPGDSLGAIAVYYDTTVYKLVQLNNIYNPDHIYVGQKIQLPGCEQPAHSVYDAPPATKGGHVHTEQRYHIVKPGETLSGICAYYGVEANVLIAANYIANPNLIFVGQKLVIP